MSRPPFLGETRRGFVRRLVIAELIGPPPALGRTPGAFGGLPPPAFRTGSPRRGQPLVPPAESSR